MNAHILKSTSPYTNTIDMVVLSHSSREMFRNCARKLEFRQFFGSPPHKQENYAGDVGNALHRGVGTWLMTKDEDKAIVEFLIHFPHNLEYLKPGNAARSMEASLGTLLTIIGSHHLLPYDVAKIKVNIDGKIEEKFCVEVPFALRIVGAPLDIPVYFVGYLDCILYNAAADRYIVVDLKTTRSNLEDPSARFQFDEQVIPYGIVLEHALGKQIQELDIAYFNAYIDLIEPRSEMLPQKKTAVDIMDWQLGLCDDIERIAKYYKKGWFPRATDGKTCVTWNSKCQFFDECYYRDIGQLQKIIQGTKRTEFFTNGDVPWITAELPFVGG